MSKAFYQDAPPRLAVYPTMVQRNQAPPPIRQRRSRTMFSETDIAHLEAAFAADPYPDINAREEMAESIGVAEARVQTWFQNKRSRTRRKVHNGRLGVSHFTPSSQASSSPGVPPSHSPTLQPRSGASSPATNRAYRASSTSPKRKFSPLPTIAPNVTRLRKSITSSPHETGQNDSGVLDLSSRSAEEEDSSPSSLLRTNVQGNTKSAHRHADADRPFFTPWATTPVSSRIQPTAVASPLLMTTPHRLANPWMLGFSPNFNCQTNSFYLQPLPASPFLHYPAAEEVRAFAGYHAPILAGVPPSLHVAQNKANSLFVYPNVQSSTPDKGQRLSPVQTQEEGLVTSSSVSSPSNASSQIALSDSPGSDSGSRSSGYSSREYDSPINVCD